MLYGKIQMKLCLLCNVLLCHNVVTGGGGGEDTYDPHLAKEPTACEKPFWFRSICNSVFSVLLMALTPHFLLQV